MVIFNALLNLRELKELYSGKPVCVCPLYNGVINTQKTYEVTGNPIVLPEYKILVKLKTTFSPKQAGTGEPSPENVRPISGYDSVTVTQSKDEAQVNQITLTLPEAIYGGTVDAVTGEGEKTWEFVEFDGTENWYQNEAGYFLNNVVDIGPAGKRESISNIAVNSGYTINPLPDGKFNTWSFINNRGWCGFSLSFADSLDSWKSYLATQVSAGTPVQVAYKLATPESFKVSQVSIPSLRGENTLFTNGENMDIIYKKEFFWGDEA